MFLKILTKITCAQTLCVHNFVCSMGTAFSNEVVYIERHHRCPKEVDRNLASQNQDILGSIHTTACNCNRVIHEKCIARAIRRRKAPVYVDARSAKIPVQCKCSGKARGSSAECGALTPSIAS